MTILHYSDKSYQNFDTLYQQADILIATGDLTLFDFGSLQFTKRTKPAFGVYGNHDSGSYLEELGIIDLHNKVYQYADLTWGGWQGSPRYKAKGGPQFTEDEAMAWSQNFPAVDVLLLHAGPKDMLDDPSDTVHIGSEAIKNYVLTKKPRYVFCGHQYSNAEMTAGDTALYRTYGARLIEI